MDIPSEDKPRHSRQAARVVRWALTLAVFIAAAAGGRVAEASPPVKRYVCTLADGSHTIVAQNLSTQFDGMALGCAVYDVRPAQKQPLPDRPLPPVVSVIRNRNAVALTRTPLVLSPYDDIIREAARRNQLETRLLMAMIQVESNHKASARSNKGALGLMQIMPDTGARYGVVQSHYLYDPAINVDVGARYLSDLIDMFGDVELAVAAFNAGEGAVLRYGSQVPPFPETQDYVKRVMELARGKR